MTPVILRNIPPFLLIISLFIFSFSALSQTLEDLTFVKSDFKNVICEAENTNCSNINGGIAFISGANFNEIDDAPMINVETPGANSTSVGYLVQSSFGHPTARHVGWTDLNGETAAEYYARQGYNFVQQVEQLFNSYYRNDNPTNARDIYLGYDFILTTDQGDVLITETNEEITLANGSVVDPDVIFSTSEVNNALENLYIALQIDPYLTVNIDEETSVELRDLILDVTYFQVVALLQQGNLSLERAFSVRFLEELRPAGKTINNELEKLGWNNGINDFDENLQSSGAWAYFQEAARVWTRLLESPIQREYLRELAASRTLDYEGIEVFSDANEPSGHVGQWPPLVFDGYKDIAAMFRTLAQRSRVVYEVAKRLVLKQQRDEAAELIQTYAQQFALEESFIYELFLNDFDATNHTNRYPGLVESIYTLRATVMELGQLRDAAVNDDLNALGFDDDVLFIRSADVNSAQATSTYDWFSSRLYNVEGQSALGALLRSETKDVEARETRIAFEQKAADYLTQFDQIEDEYDQQLIAIAGPDPTNFRVPNLTNPEEGGGLLDQQLSNIEIARNDIERVVIQMNNIRSSIEIEQDRVEQLGIVSDKRIQIIRNTGNQVADLQQEIANIQGEMAFASSMAAAVSSAGDFSFDFGTGGVAAHTANAFIQRELSQKIGQKQAAITNLQAEQQARFEYLNQEGIAINSAAQIQTMFLDMRTLQVDLINAELRLGQEMKRLVQYYNQIDNLVMRRDRALDRLSRRSFADPTYRIEVTNSAIEAEDAFQTAQRWVYLMAKALEYKWPVNDSILNLLKQDILQARTAEKLVELIQTDMRTFNDLNQTTSANYYYLNYSLKEDYHGFKFDKELPGGTTQTETEQFVAKLHEHLNDFRFRRVVDNKEYVAVPFSTVKFQNTFNSNAASITIENSGGESINASNQPIFVEGLWDSKIDWVQVDIVGNNVSENDPQQMGAFLRYGGTGFLRTKSEFMPAGSADEIDYLVFSNPAYDLEYTPGSRGFGWITRDFITQRISAKLVSNPRNIPDAVFKANGFRERPLASTAWEVLIPVNETKFENIRDIEINILYTARTRQ